MATWIKQMKTSYIYRFFGILIFLQNLYAPLFSDLIVTKDGSRIKGDLILFEDGNLTFQTKFAGKIRVSTNEIDSLQTDSAISVGFQTTEHSRVKFSSRMIENTD